MVISKWLALMILKSRELSTELDASLSVKFEILVQHLIIATGSQRKFSVRFDLLSAGGQRKRCSVVAKDIAERRKEYVAPRTINNCRHREGLRPFHVIPKPFKTETDISARLWFWGNNIWPGQSPDLNVAKHTGTIIKDEVEGK